VFAERCVQEQTGRCYDLGADSCDGFNVETPPPPPECNTTVRHGTCAEAGYTRPCSGGYAVRPGSSC
jgi:hypothetical protein